MELSRSMDNVTLTNSGAEGTIQGKGTINGSLTFAPNTSPTHLTPGYSYASEVLTVNGNVTMNANTKFQPLSSGTATSFLQVNGNLNLGSAAGNSVIVNGPALPHGSYSIIKFTGTRTGTLAPPTTPTGATTTYVDTPGAGSVVLNIP